MKKLTFDEFEKNKTYILAVTKEQKEKRFEWLKENNYENLNGSTINKDFKCHNGYAALDAFARGSRSFDNVYTVEQLEWKPKLKYNVGDCFADKYGDYFKIIGKENNYYQIAEIDKYGHIIDDGYPKSYYTDEDFEDDEPYTPIERPLVQVDDVVKCIREHAVWNTIVKVGQLEHIYEIEKIGNEECYFVNKRTKLFSRYFDKDYINEWVVVDKNTLTVEELKNLGFEVEVK